MLIQETHLNRTEGYMLGESGPYEPFAEDPGELYRGCLGEYGRCVGKVRIDTAEKEGRPIGWVFVRRAKYQDCDETYLHETWVTLYEEPDTVVRTKHYLFLD